ncbi:MAG: hypothetical protein ACFFCO_10565, partial [Promethearchaeota archaeon]
MTDVQSMKTMRGFTNPWIAMLIILLPLVAVVASCACPSATTTPSFTPTPSSTPTPTPASIS